MKYMNSKVIGIAIIGVTLVLALKIVGVISFPVASVVLSWQALLILLGITGMCLFRQGFIGHAILILTGFYFILPELQSVFGFKIGVEPDALKSLYWVSVLCVIGIGIVLKDVLHTSNRKDRYQLSRQEIKGNGKKVVINALFTGSENIYLDNSFKGATLDCTFGGIVLNLKNTILEDTETVIDVACSFGGIIIIVPESWNVTFDIKAILGGTNDKRSVRVTKGDKSLLIRGSVVFGGVELKSELPSDENIHCQHENTMNAEEDSLESITVKQNNRVYIISVDELVYIKAEGDYVTLSTSQGNFLKDQTMKYFETALPSAKFLRIHRSHIVNLSYVSSVESRKSDSYYIVLKNGTELKASSSGYQQLKERLYV